MPAGGGFGGDGNLFVLLDEAHLLAAGVDGDGDSLRAVGEFQLVGVGGALRGNSPLVAGVAEERVPGVLHPLGFGQIDRAKGLSGGIELDELDRFGGPDHQGSWAAVERHALVGPEVVPAPGDRGEDQGEGANADHHELAGIKFHGGRFPGWAKGGARLWGVVVSLGVRSFYSRGPDICPPFGERRGF